MSELQWYALAEIYLNKPADKSTTFYCLCSRVFLRNKDDQLKRTVFSADQSASEEEFLIKDKEEIPTECSLPQLLKNKLKDTDPVSCYCSASHTDNLSTDEHDSLRDSHLPLWRGLQSSDSGADLTECLRQDIDHDWQKFWSLNGEKLIWESWIAKYSAYINPDYLQYAQEKLDPSPQFSFESDEILAKDVRNRILVRNLSGSDDKLFTEISEGWNPLSPTSVDGETDAEQLLSSRCGSGSLRTVDSMTNVTRMTISSLCLSHSSPSSGSFSSVSSVQSCSLSPTSSEEADEDYQHQWNVLWKKHYEDECLSQYQIFVAAWKEHTATSEKVVTIVQSPSYSSKKKSNIHKVFCGKVENDDFKQPIQVASHVAESLGTLLDSLKIAEKMDESKPGDEEAAQMASMGLPTNFGAPKRSRSEESDNPPTNPDGDFESGRKRIKAAFNLMGIVFTDTNQNSMGGQVNYKMKHIRLQNRHLKLLKADPAPENKHIRFDDDGNAAPVAEIDEPNFGGVLSDSSDNRLSSADEEFLNESVAKADETFEDYPVPKRRKRKRKLQVPPEIKENTQLRKYWHRRFVLFSKFDEGIKLDEESWYSVTPEHIAKHIAERCRCDVIVDGFCGAGGNSIQFAMTCQKVIAIDIDPKKIELARNNAEVYGVADRIEFIVGDFFQLSHTLKADVAFFSPPWGGPSYLKEIVYDLDSMLLPVPISQLLEAGRRITENIAVFLPKNSNSFLLIDDSKPGGGVEIEQNFMKKKLVSITAYYNDLVKKIQAN